MSIAESDQSSTAKKGKARFLLSPRESEVLYWLKMGKTSWDIANILNISERTVNYHVGNIIEKLGVSSRMQAVFEVMTLESTRVE